MWIEPRCGHGRFLAGGSENFGLDEWVVRIDLLANRLTRWPTPYNWQVGYNIFYPTLFLLTFLSFRILYLSKGSKNLADLLAAS